MNEQSSENRLCKPARLDQLPDIQKFVTARATALGLPESFQLKLELVLEELVVNISQHAYPDGDGNIEICCFLEEQETALLFHVKIKDWGIAFNPLEAQPPDTNQTIDDCPVGGLGIFLTTQTTDVISYERQDNCNIISFGFIIN